MIRIFADFNNSDEQDRVRLTTVGSLWDLEQHRDEIAEGMKVILYDPGEFEVIGTLVFDKIWMGIPDWNTIRYENPEDSPK